MVAWTVQPKSSDKASASRKVARPKPNVILLCRNQGRVT
jgi:hypothetical protein